MDSKGQIHRRKINLGLLNAWRVLAHEIAGGYKDGLENISEYAPESWKSMNFKFFSYLNNQTRKDHVGFTVSSLKFINYSATEQEKHCDHHLQRI